LQIDELELRIAKALKSRHLESENQSLHERLDKKFGMENVIGDSPQMKAMLETIRQIAPAPTTVLVTGESGTGKEIVAKTIHQLSPRSRAAMVAVHLGGLPATLVESELFGHEKGSFTGAHERRVGRVEQAQGGTLFLDEIGEIEPQIQIKLLRFLGERTFERVGSNKTLKADVRVITATNKNLLDLVREGKFREDLYYRLRVVELHLPPLRERKSDVPLLAQSFLKEFSTEQHKDVRDFTVEAMERLLKHPWPGNVRELRSAIEHAVAFSRGDRIQVADLPEDVRQPASSLVIAPTSQTLNATTPTVKEAEKQLVIRALREADGNRTLAARKLGFSRRTLHRKLHEYHLEGF
jgi:DNA-binding NtrC family response regulator